MMKAIFWVSTVCGIFLTGCSSKNSASTEVLVETNTPVFASNVAELHPNGFEPLVCEAVGVADPDGSFVPVTYLGTPIPHGGGQYPIRLSTNSTFKVYRGTNHIAAKNVFLGEYRVKTSPSAEKEVCIDFEISNKRDLVVSASTDATGNKPLRVEKISTQN